MIQLRASAKVLKNAVIEEKAKVASLEENARLQDQQQRRWVDIEFYYFFILTRHVLLCSRISSDNDSLMFRNKQVCLFCHSRI